MADENGKKNSPPYVSFSSFTSFIKGLQETHVPGRIDKTVMSNYSGSVVYALLPALQWLGLIDDNGAPQPVLHALCKANEDEYKKILKGIVEDRYSFVFNSDFDLATASSGQVIEAFRAQEISGSTITKSMSFFLSIAKEAGIKVSSHVKAPTVKRASSPKKKKPKNDAGGEDNGIDEPVDEAPPPGTEKITFSLRGKPDVVVYFPEGLEGNEAEKVIKATVFNLKMYYGLDPYE